MESEDLGTIAYNKSRAKKSSLEKATEPNTTWTRPSLTYPVTPKPLDDPSPTPKTPKPLDDPPPTPKTPKPLDDPPLTKWLPSGDETSALDQAVNRYGGKEKFAPVLSAARKYREEYPGWFPQVESFDSGHMASPRIDQKSMEQKFPIKRISYPEGSDTHGETSQEMDGIAISDKDSGDEAEAFTHHEVIHRTDYPKYRNTQSATSIPKTSENTKNAIAIREQEPLYPRLQKDRDLRSEHDDYLMTRKEINARLPRLNSMHMSAGGAFPTSAEEGEKVFASFGLTKGDARPEISKKHQEELNRNPDVEDWINSVWKMPKDERIRIIDERAKRQPGQVENSPQKNPLDAVV